MNDKKISWAVTTLRKGRRYLILLALVNIANVNIAQADENDALDFLPAIIAGADRCKTQNQDSLSSDLIANDCDLVIDDNYDLGSQVINLPPNVELDFSGGSIVNGTLIFRGGTIDGRLLNPNLTVTGNVKLKSRVFVFMPSIWNIVEGVISDVVAASNTDIINRVMNRVIELGADTFSIGKMDAYFGIQDVRKPRAIFIPSNFNFVMTDNTNIRTQPNGLTEYALLFSWEMDNVLISGGKLWGDRYAHDYTSNNGVHDWGHVIAFKAVHNGTIDNVEMHEAVGDGFILSSSADRNLDGSLKPDRRESTNITVKNSLLANNRRNNMSIVDGKDVFIEYSTIRGGGSGDGTSPRAGIDIESRGGTNPDGNSIYQLEKTDNVHIRHNTFEDNIACDVVLLTGQNTYVYGNTFQSKCGVVSGWSPNNKIYNNTFERPDGLMDGSFGIKINARYWVNGENRVKDFEIYDNTISGYQFGIYTSGQGHDIINNTMINNQRGITLGNSEDLYFENNIISSNVNNSFGYYTFSEGTSIKNTLIKNGETNVQGRDLTLSQINSDEAGSITFDNVDFNGTGLFLNSAHNVTIQNSSFDDIEIRDSDPALINNNQ